MNLYYSVDNTEKLLAEAKGNRVNARQHALDDIRAQLEEQLDHSMRLLAESNFSLRCKEATYWAGIKLEHHGCMNDGSTCLCPCHDKPAP